jgi:hypothetical protein
MLVQRPVYIYIYIHSFTVCIYTPTETLAYCTHFGVQTRKKHFVFCVIPRQRLFSNHCTYARDFDDIFMQIINDSSDLSEV